MTVPFIPPEQFQRMAVNAVFQGLKGGPGNNNNNNMNNILPYVFGEIINYVGKNSLSGGGGSTDFFPPTGGCGPVPKVPPVPRV